MAATVKEVAQRAGVSVATVSKYMNGGNVKEAYRIKVEEAVKELDYAINAVARNLKTNKSYMVGILTPEITSSFVTSVISLIQKNLLDMGYTTLILDYQADRKQESRQLDVLIQFKVDGMILFPAFNEVDLVETIKKNNIPLLLVDNQIYGADCDAIVTNNRESSYEATKKMIACNHKHIVICRGPEETYTANERYLGYLDAMTESGLTPVSVNGSYTIEGGYQAIKQLAADGCKPTAIISCNYHMTIGILRALYELNWRIPEDISMIAFDEQVFDFALPVSISAIIQPLKEVSACAAKRIVEMIEKKDTERTPSVDVLKASLNETESFQAI